MSGKVLAVDLGGTNLRVALVDEDGTIHEARRQPTADEGRLDHIVALAREAGLDRAAKAVVGVAGRVDHRLGRVEHAPNLDDSWDPLLHGGALAGALGIPVSLANDADLAAVGEAWFGAGRGRADVAYLTLSTGVGAGVVLGGRLLHGRRSIAELGHTIIDIGAASAGLPATVEELASGTALETVARQVGLDISGREVVERASLGDRVAAAVLHDVLRAGAVAAVNLAHLFTPELIVVGGGFGRSSELVLDAMREVLASHGPKGLPEPIEVVVAALGDDAALAGAAAWERAFA